LRKETVDANVLEAIPLSLGVTMKTHENTPLNRFFDGLIEAHKLKNDAALCRLLNVGAAAISKHRRGITPITAHLMVRVHERTGMPLAEMRAALPAESFYDFNEAPAE
jgi:hypothetical protein